MTYAFGGRHSIQLSYGCVGVDLARRGRSGKVGRGGKMGLAAREEEAPEVVMQRRAGRADNHSDMAGWNFDGLP